MQVSQAEFLCQMQNHLSWLAELSLQQDPASLPQEEGVPPFLWLRWPCDTAEGGKCAATDLPAV